MQYVIGVDGGGTKTQAVLLDPEGRMLGRGFGGAANPSTAGLEAAGAALCCAVRESLHEAARLVNPLPSVQDVAAIGLGVAGATDQQDWLRAVAAQIAPGALAVLARHDAEIALVGALGGLRGIVLIAGTGSVAYGVNAAGESALVGGWGFMLDDEGSGFAIGRAALRAYLRVCDGRAAPSPLSETLAARLGTADHGEIVAWAYREKPQVRKVADLAPLVMELAAQDDAAARTIIDQAADELVDLVRGAWKRLDLGCCEVGLVGGALRWEGELAGAVVEKLGRLLPDVTPTPPRADSATGAAWLAMRALGWRK